jgi:hypothetical protein
MRTTLFSVSPRATPSNAPTSLVAFFWLFTKPSRPVIFAVLVFAS